MTSHDGLDAALDGTPVHGAKGRLPLFQVERIHRGQHMLVARIEALAWPVLGGGRQAGGLHHVDVHGAHAGHTLRRGPKGACAHDRAAEVRIDVNDRREGPVDADRTGLLGHDVQGTAIVLGVGQRSHPQLVGHLRGAIQADRAALDVAADQHRDRSRVQHAACGLDSSLQAAHRELGNGTRLKPAQHIEVMRIFRHEHHVEQLGQALGNHPVVPIARPPRRCLRQSDETARPAGCRVK